MAKVLTMPRARRIEVFSRAMNKEVIADLAAIYNHVGADTFDKVGTNLVIGLCAVLARKYGISGRLI
jgi:hypothetical protein